MKKIISALFIAFVSFSTATSQWSTPGVNPYIGATNPIIQRSNPYLIFDSDELSKSGLRFWAEGDLEGAMVFEDVGSVFSFGEDLNTENSVLSIGGAGFELEAYPLALLVGGILRVGEEKDKRIVLDRNDIQAFDTLDVVSALRLNHFGGNVNIGNGGLVYIAASDKTGVGTVSPKKRLDVNGDIALSNGTGSIDFYEGPDLKAFIEYNGNELSIVNDEDELAFSGKISIESRKELDLSTNGLSGAPITMNSIGNNSDIMFETFGSNSDIVNKTWGVDSPVTIETDDDQSDITLETNHVNSDIHLLSMGDISIENTSPNGKLSFLTMDTLSFSTSGLDAPIQISTLGINNSVSMTTASSNSDINIETNGFTSDINLLANGSSGDIELNAGSDVDLEAGGIIRFWNNDALTMILDAEGKVGIGTSNPQYDLQVEGDLDITGEFTAASDRKLKRNIVSISNASALIAALNPVKYYFRTDEYPSKNFSERQKMGLIAQEVEAVLPDLVSSSGSVMNSKGEQVDIKSVNYMELIPLLVRCNQEQDETIRLQEQKIKALEEQNLQLNQGLEWLKLKLTQMEAKLSKQL